MVYIWMGEQYLINPLAKTNRRGASPECAIGIPETVVRFVGRSIDRICDFVCPLLRTILADDRSNSVVSSNVGDDAMEYVLGVGYVAPLVAYIGCESCAYTVRADLT
jgi:hypothetical protein